MSRAGLPLPRPVFRRSHIEWLLHHGHGDRLGKFGPSREIADFEYADGTPSTVSPSRFAFKHHQDHLLVQLIRAAATVERLEAADLLPRIPGTPEQRNWDPEIPLFLDDMDESDSAVTAAGSSIVNQFISTHFTEEASVGSSASAANRNCGETLEANTLFATYDPAAFVSDAIASERRRPFWSRRRWALSDNFMVPVSPKAKNTIKDE